MGAAVNPFTPNTGGTITITVAATSASVALTKGGVDCQVMVSSLAANAIAFIEFGAAANAATVATGTPILPGRVYTFTLGATQTNVATIGTAANTLYFTTGQGMNPS